MFSVAIVLRVLLNISLSGELEEAHHGRLCGVHRLRVGHRALMCLSGKSTRTGSTRRKSAPPVIRLGSAALRSALPGPGPRYEFSGLGRPIWGCPAGVTRIRPKR